ncbi:TRAP-type C4-dicarboxylate transport system, substrate-binding protein [Desulfatibacillum alkenivorans DSM 16219]|jgi:TRAP-type C4-dicarboxylate transport system substrate-binding protein|uniref:TRAP-type C4-dicarboxylate transport system, substrate-binding protein n=1 Tax=Desulfatibacillum alkenivorans DSM 16219 TaxID=1121393 RepID=A0A1M6S4I8_9BACT|nr:TRAP transporter substrate-binding protein DctP [Desulfatibacillum alkenivorans]SHK39417.1 TRAP-type C4-dicarboxylate transport system, substrate-binding protein [Desulfatibacillum alkenivorans DSM 16219]
MLCKRLLLSVAAAMLLLGGIGQGRAETGAVKPKYVWKYATLAPNGIGWAVHIQDLLLPMVQERTNGEVRLKIYWGGVMGDDEDILKKMRIGQLNGAGLSGQGVTMAVPEMTVLELPFLFRNYDEVDYIREQMMPEFDSLAEKHGLFLVGLIDQDFDQIYSVKYPMNKLENFEKSTFSCWYGDLEANMLKSLGASAVPVNVPEISTSLRQGVIDANIGPAIWQVGSQMYSVYKYVNTSKIRYSPALMIQRKEDFEASEDVKAYKEALLQERSEFVKLFTERVRVDNQKCLDAMLKYGLILAQASDEDMKVIAARTRPVWDEMAGVLYPRELLDELLEHLAEFREEN